MLELGQNQPVGLELLCRWALLHERLHLCFLNLGIHFWDTLSVSVFHFLFVSSQQTRLISLHAEYLAYKLTDSAVICVELSCPSSLLKTPQSVWKCHLLANAPDSAEKVLGLGYFTEWQTGLCWKWALRSLQPGTLCESMKKWAGQWGVSGFVIDPKAQGTHSREGSALWWARVDLSLVPYLEKAWKIK